MIRERFLLVTVVMALGAGVVGVESGRTQIQYQWGENVAPVYEGWVRNPDRTIDMWFGYLNKNWDEVLHIPVGPDNNIEPGGPDRGQPTRFISRRAEGTAVQRRESFVFAVRLPGDWNPAQEVTWTVAAHGKSDRAIGVFTPYYELATVDKNVPPTVQVTASAESVSVSDAVTVTARVTDDGQPVNRRSRANVAWLHYRGPGRVTFDPPRSPIPATGDVKNVAVATTARFSEPGTYTLRAMASDGDWFGGANVMVTVSAAQSASAFLHQTLGGFGNLRSAR